MIPIKRDGLLTIIETKELVKLVELALSNLYYIKEVDDTSKYDGKIKEYELILDNLRSLD